MQRLLLKCSLLRGPPVQKLVLHTVFKNLSPASHQESFLVGVIFFFPEFTYEHKRSGSLANIWKKSPVLVIIIISHYSPGKFAGIFNYTIDSLFPAFPDQPGPPPALPQWSEDCSFPTTHQYPGETGRVPGVTLPLLRSLGPSLGCFQHGVRG